VVFAVDKVALGQVFSKYFGFPCQFSFHQMLDTHLSSGAGTIGQLVADVPSGLSLTPPQDIKKTSRTSLPSFEKYSHSQGPRVTLTEKKKKFQKYLLRRLVFFYIATNGTGTWESSFSSIVEL
jgi:hypothetical protein